MASSPLAHLGPKRSNRRPQLYQPRQSSPLSECSSPIYNTQAKRKREYKPQHSSPSVPSFVCAFEDTTQKRFMRERLKAHCLERARKGRARAVQKRRELSAANGSSSDGFEEVDAFMDDGDEDVLNDEIYHRVMLNEVHRSQYAQRVSFEHEFGSSIDPNMYEDMSILEWEFTGRAPELRSPSPPSEDLDDALIQEYLSELEEVERREAQQSGMVASTGVIGIDTGDPNNSERAIARESGIEPSACSENMFDDFQMSSPPCSPSRSGSEVQKFSQNSISHNYVDILFHDV